MPSKPTKSPKAVRLITKPEALRRAQDHLMKQVFTGAKIRRGHFNTGAGLNEYPVWFVHPNLTACGPAFRPAHVVIVCQQTGKILYTGSDHHAG